MDLTKLVGRLKEHRYNNVILSFEKGQVVRRSHATVYEDVKAAGRALTKWGVRSGMRVGIRSSNCYEWIVYDLALIALRAVSVAFTDDFADVTASELCDRYELSLLLIGAHERTRYPSDTHFIACLGGPNSGIGAIDRGTPQADENFDRPGLIFSSGSSGGLKGLILNRRGIEASIDAFAQAVGPRLDDRLLLFLPIANFQQRLMYYAALWYGFDLIVTDPTCLFRALKELQPTILIAPPMLYEAFETRFYNLPKWKRQAAEAMGEIVRRLPGLALQRKLVRTLFRQAHEALGGRMRFMVTGMAPIKRTTLELFARMQLPLFETYGLIESGSVTLNVPRANRLGSVGRTLPGVSVEFAADGEIIVCREHAISVGYFACDEGESERTFIGNNRIATGDIGRLDEDGYLYLVGRKKEMIVTPGGEKIHPEVIEAEIDTCREVARSVVFEREHAPGLVAVVLPKHPEDRAARARIERFVEGVNDRRFQVAVGKLVFTDIVFSRENGFLRPNLKLDRKTIRQHFQGEIGNSRR